MSDQLPKSTSATGSVADPGNVLFDVWLVSRATTALVDKVVQPSGLDADEFGIYSVLASGDGLTSTELARWMSAPATTVSSYAKRFEARSHVRRAPNPADGRSYLLQLTEDGRRVHLTARMLFAPVLDAVNGQIGDGLDDIRRRVRELHQVVAELDPPTE